VVRQRQEVPADHIAVGVPAKILDKTIDDAYKAEWMGFKQTYVDLARRYPAGLQKLPQS
jgi:carbonic anhydrase/acetyltransferase-like protein (isoleucine patch superfamily)